MESKGIMKQTLIKQINDYVEKHIGEFHSRRLEMIERLKLSTVLKKKNPYLFRCKDLNTPESIIRAITEASISSSEETLFGDWLEELAIYINSLTYNGRKSGIPGIDLEFDSQSGDQYIKYIVSIKSGPNWANSSQLKKMVLDFTAAKKTLRTSHSRLHVQAVLGCCYGKDAHSDKGEYFRYCGQDFWYFISGEDTLFTDLIEPLGYQAREQNEQFRKLHAELITRFTVDFCFNFCQDGKINWEKLVSFNSGRTSSLN